MRPRWQKLAKTNPDYAIRLAAKVAELTATPSDVVDEDPDPPVRKQPLMEGWLILKADGRPWEDALYPSEQAAHTTAEQCGVTGFSVVREDGSYRLTQVVSAQLVFTRP